MEIAEKVASLRESKGLSQQALADLVGVSQAAINSIESGKTKRSKFLPKIARALAVPLEELDPEVATSGPAPTWEAPVSPAQPLPDISRRPVPVLGQAVGGDDGHIIFNGSVVDYVMCPPGMETVRDAYAVYVAGESMVPVFRPGYLVWVNPALPPRRGDEVIIQLHSEDGEPPEGFVKEFVGYQGGSLVVRQYNPTKDIQFDRNEVKSVHVITFAQRR